MLVEAGPRLLPAFPPTLSEAARRSLERLHVEVRLGTPVSQCDDEGVTIGDERLEAATIVWAAGVAASPARAMARRRQGSRRPRHGRARPVAARPSRDLRASATPPMPLDGDGQPLPGLAPVAKQQGAYVARVLRARLAGRPAPPPFRYRDYGTIATIGRRAAVADFGWLRLHGTLAWLLWGLVHISFLIGFRNRLVVMLDWLWSYVTFQSGARLITGSDPHSPDRRSL